MAPNNGTYNNRRWAQVISMLTVVVQRATTYCSLLKGLIWCLCESHSEKKPDLRWEPFDVASFDEQLSERLIHELFCFGQNWIYMYVTCAGYCHSDTSIYLKMECIKKGCLLLSFRCSGCTGMYERCFLKLGAQRVLTLNTNRQLISARKLWKLIINLHLSMFTFSPILGMI